MDGPASGPPSFCPDCGADLDYHANYCPGCGTAVRDSPTAAFCRTCGSEFDRGDEFCANCGTPRDVTAPREETATAPRDRREAPDTVPPRDRPGRSTPSGNHDSQPLDEDERLFRRRVRSYLADGWSVERDYGDSVVLVDRGVGNVGIHVLLLLFTGGLGNLVYGWYHYQSNAARIHLSVDDPTPTGPPRASGKATADDGEADGLRWLVGGFLLLLAVGTTAGTLSTPVASPLFLTTYLGFSLLLLVVGTLVLPPARDRLDRRKPVTTFGTVKSTDETVVHEPDTPCVVCGRPIDRGVERSYREEAVVAGLPLFATESGENHYCEECAAEPATDPEEAFGTGTSDDETAEADADAESNLEFERD